MQGKWTVFAALLVGVLVLALAMDTAATQYRPSTIESMDLEVTMEVEGAFSGTVYDGDSLELRILTLNNSNTQQIQESDEQLLIGERALKPEYRINEGNKYAVFKLDNLMDYASTPRFRFVSKTRVKTQARLDSLVDYDLSKPLQGPVEEFLKASRFIEANDPELVSKAQLEFSGTTSELETIREITEWVHQNIVYDFENYYNGMWSAKDTYNSRRGVCDEFANLTAAFMRAKGIPTLYVSGVSFDGERFGNHGWNEAYLGGKGWIGVDSTYGEAGYLDAAHLVLGKGLDANDLSNFYATTWSRKPIKVDAVLHDPVVEIKDVSFFKDVLDIQLEAPEKLGLDEEFEVRAQVKNKRDYSLIVPLELALHEEFKYTEREKLVLLKPFEEKTLTWKARAPGSGQEGHFAKYGLAFLAPDQNIEETLLVYPEEAAKTNGVDIQVKDLSPYISSDSVKLVLILENAGAAAGDVDIQFKYYGVQQQMQDTLQPGQRKKFEFKADFVKPGSMQLEIGDGQTVKQIEIMVPKQVIDEALQGAEVKIGDKDITQTTKEKPGYLPEDQAIANTFEALRGLWKEVEGAGLALYVVAGLFGVVAILWLLKFLVRK